MAFPILFFSRGCCGAVEVITSGVTSDLAKKIKFDKDVKIKLATVVFDTFVSLTALVVGILGATSLITMPAAAAYALIGVSSVITLSWIAIFIAAKQGFRPNHTPKHT